MKHLDLEQANKKLQQLHQEWALLGDESLHRVFNFEDYSTAIRFVNDVATIAEELNHHPDIHVAWRKVEVVSTTHDASGVTNKDFELAHKIDELG